MKSIYNQISKFAKLYNAKSVVLFGSRSRGDHSKTSDIDIAVYKMPVQNRGEFWDKLDELDTLLKIDIVYVDDNTDKLLIENITKDGIILMNKFNDKFSKLQNAVKRLEEAILEYNQTNSDSVRDGAIQRFEFCTELSWKTVREKLIDEGIIDINSPKAVIREAFKLGIITQDTIWLNLLADRNSTSHIYDEQTAQDIYESIQSDYLMAFKDLIESLK